MSSRLPAADPRQAELLAAASVDGSRAQPAKKRQRESDVRQDQKKDHDDESFDPEDDEDLGLSDADDDERIGLDTSTGFDETSDDLDFAVDREEDEDERWSVDSEEAGDLAEGEPDLFPGEEYGWIGDDEPPTEAEDDDFDADLEDDDGRPGDDGGAEGVEDESDLDDLELSELPELDADAEEDLAAGVEGLDELGGLALIDEPTLQIAAGELWKMLPARAVRVTAIPMPAPAQPITAMLAHGRSLFYAASGLYRLAPDGIEPRALPLPAAGSPGSLALGEQDGELQLAVVVAGHLYVSRDAGQHFEQHPQSGLGGAFFTRSASGLRLWWRTTRAELGSDHGAAPLLPADQDGELLALHADGRRSLALLVKRDGRPVLLTSTDAGKRFSRQALPPFAASAASGGAPIALQACRDALLLVSEREARCAQPPGAFEPIATLARAPAVLSDEEDEAFVYACVARGDEWLVVRRAAAARSAAPLVIAAFGADLVSEPRALAVGYGEGGALSVFVAGDATLLRIDASLDGEELA